MSALGTRLRGLTAPAHSRARVLAFDAIAVTALMVAGLAWIREGPFWVPEQLGYVHIGVAYFGALGAVMRSLHGATRLNRANWNASWEAWHYFRPPMGAIAGIIAVLIFVAGMLGSGLTLNETADQPQNLTFFLVAFVVGYTETLFFELLKRLAEVVLTTTKLRPAIVDFQPHEAVAGATIHVLGEHLGETTGVLFSGVASTQVTVESDSLVVVKIPDDLPAADHPVSVLTANGAASGHLPVLAA